MCSPYLGHTCRNCKWSQVAQHRTAYRNLNRMFQRHCPLSAPSQSSSGRRSSSVHRALPLLLSAVRPSEQGPATAAAPPADRGATVAQPRCRAAGGAGAAYRGAAAVKAVATATHDTELKLSPPPPPPPPRPSPCHRLGMEPNELKLRRAPLASTSSLWRAPPPPPPPPPPRLLCSSSSSSGMLPSSESESVSVDVAYQGLAGPSSSSCAAGAFSGVGKTRRHSPACSTAASRCI